MKQERSKVKSDILLRVRLLYVLFILAGAIVLARLVWVQLFSAEVAYNADRLAGRIFTEEVDPGPAGQHPFARRRTAGHVDLPLSGRVRLRLAGARFAQDIPGAGRLAGQAAGRLFPGQTRLGLLARGSATNTPAATGW